VGTSHTIRYIESVASGIACTFYTSGITKGIYQGDATNPLVSSLVLRHHYFTLPRRAFCKRLSRWSFLQRLLSRLSCTIVAAILLYQQLRLERTHNSEQDAARDTELV